MAFNLDPVMRGVTPEESRQALGVDQTVVALNRAGEQWKSKLFGENPQYLYLVSNANVAEAVARHDGVAVSLFDPAADHRLSLVISFEARCAKGDEFALAQKLCNRQVTERLVKESIDGGVAEATGGSTVIFVENFKAAQLKVAAEIEKKLKEKCELTAKVQVKQPSGQIDSGPLELRVDVTPMDAFRSFPLQAVLMVTIAKKDETLAHACSHRYAELQVQLKKSIEEHVSRISTHELFFTLASTFASSTINLKNDLFDRLKNELQELLKPAGRTLSVLKLKCELPAGVEEKVLVTHTYDCQLSDDNQSFKITHTAEMAVNNLGLVLASSLYQGSFQKWAMDTMESTGKRVMARVSHLEMINRDEAVKDAIKLAFGADLLAIGYQLLSFSSRTTLQFDLIKQPRQIKFTASFSAASAHPRLWNHQVKLGFTCNLRISTINARVSQLLQDGKDINEELEKAMTESAAHLLRKVPVLNYYLFFTSDSPEQEPPVRAALENGVAQMLRNEFGATVRSISADREADGVVELYQEIARVHPVAFSVERPEGEYRFSGNLALTIETPQEFSLFLSQRGSVTAAQILHYAQDFLTADIMTLNAGVLVSTQAGKQQNVLGRRLSEALSGRFGCKAALDSWRQAPAENEFKFAKHQNATLDRTLVVDTERDELRWKREKDSVQGLMDREKALQEEIARHSDDSPEGREHLAQLKADLQEVESKLTSSLSPDDAHLQAMKRLPLQNLQNALSPDRLIGPGRFDPDTFKS